MKFILNILTAFVLPGFMILGLTACDEDTFSQVVEVEIPEHRSAVVLNGFWFSQDSLLDMLVSNSLSILDNSDFTVPQDADVKLYKNGNLLGNLTLNQEIFKYQMPLNESLGAEGATYKIEAVFGDLEPVSVEQTMPGLVEIKEAKYQPEGTFDPTGEKVDEFSITFNDPPGEENYYLFRASTIEQYEDWNGDTITYRNYIYLDSNDPIAEYSEKGLIFSDKAFNGNEYTIKGWNYSWWEQVEKFEMELVSISKDGYLYLRSLENYNNAEGNPFAQPATVYSNIQNGYGIFALGASDKVLIYR
ncbi:MAG: DUF4249 domain-containing protein [Saprospiraceae bacterium]|nr:DUF4249 domain-containing protein [Saprospiraceae bacterium]MCB9325557.1 DUF4249 domain-containing protein [Lewinellaceae bacterium]